MPAFADVDLSEFIVSIANSVSEANSILNQDPQSSMAITRFEVDASLTAVISVPARQEQSPSFTLRREAASGLYRVADFSVRRIPAAKLAYLQPSLLEAFLPGSQTRTAQVQIRALMEAVPKVSPA
jgi:hypothetical protein